MPISDRNSAMGAVADNLVGCLATLSATTLTGLMNASLRPVSTPSRQAAKSLYVVMLIAFLPASVQALLWFVAMPAWSVPGNTASALPQRSPTSLMFLGLPLAT